MNNHPHVPRDLYLFGEIFETYVGIFLKLEHGKNLLKENITKSHKKPKNPDYIIVKNDELKRIIEVKAGPRSRKLNNQLDYFLTKNVPIDIIYYPSKKNVSSKVDVMVRNGVTNIFATNFEDLNYVDVFRDTYLHKILSNKKEYDNFLDYNNAAELFEFVDDLYINVESEFRDKKPSERDLVNLKELVNSHFYN